MDADAPLSAQTRRTVVVLIFGAALPLLDTSVVNVAIHPLANIFGTSVGLTQWVITGYALAATVAITGTGFATHRFGAAAVWNAAIALFTGASLLCAFAWNIESLIGFRVLQGFAAGLSMPVMMTLLITSAGKTQATRALAAVSLPAIIAPVLGPTLGGILIDTLGWRSIFLINLPIGVVALILALRVLPASQPTDRTARLDLAGVALLAPGLILAVYGLTGTAPGDGAWMIGLWLLAATALLAGYAWWARRATHPLIHLAAFTAPTFTSAWLSLTLSSMVFYGGMFLIPLWYQTVHGYTSVQTGLMLAFLGIGAVISRSLVNRLIGHWGTRATAYFFIACTVIGTVPFIIAAPRTTAWLLVEIVALIVRGGGIGAITMIGMSALYHRIPVAHIPHVSALTRVATQFGSALGVALCNLLLVAAGGIGHTAFFWFSAINAVLAVTALRLPDGRIIRE